MRATLPSGVMLLAAEVEGRPVGMFANSLVSVSLDPPLVTVSFGRTSSTRKQLRRASAVGISVLAANPHLHTEVEAGHHVLAAHRDPRVEP